MENLDIQYICTIIGSLSGVPIRVWQGEELLLYHSIAYFPKDPAELYMENIRCITANVGYFVTPYFQYYGIVNSGQTKIVLGPTRQIAGGDQELKELAFQSDVAADDVEDFVTGMKSIVPMPLDSILQILCTMNYILNKEKLALEDITIYESEQNDLKDLLEWQRSADAFSLNNDIQPYEHNTYALEQELLHMVRKGEVTTLREWIAAAPAIRGGILAPDQLRQVKNTFIVTATLVSRAAIRGGMSVEDSFTLSDAFIQKCELLNSMDRITNLQYHMILEFAERVERLRPGGNPTQLTIAVTDYIKHHLSEPIRADALARGLFISRPHLSSKFRKETGVTLTDFILQEKVNEAKQLLRYSDKSATAISSYLAFSSLGHFSRVFKKYTGQTPGEYREKYALNDRPNQ